MIPPLLLALLFLARLLPAQTLYATEFEEFENDISGVNGWLGTSPGTDSYGIDQDLVDGIGKSAFLGFEAPSSTTVTLVKGHDFEPLAYGKPTVNFESLLGIEDSSNGRRDTFAIVFLNRAGSLLASIQFRNQDSDFGIWYSDGVTVRDTTIGFTRGELSLLTAQINFETNTWSVQFDGIDLFNRATFHAGSLTRDLGFTGAQWLLTSTFPQLAGDNFLLLADWIVQSEPTEDFTLLNFHCHDDQSVFTFLGEPGFEYRLENSATLAQWAPLTTMVPDVTGTQELTTAITNAKQFYRVVRDFAGPPPD